MKPRYGKWKHRSGLETKFKTATLEKGYNLGYETSSLSFTTRPETHKYTPDWTIKDGWYIETKGYLDLEGRKKLLYVKEQHPEARILVVFQRPTNPIYKGSPTDYGKWCDKNGIEWCAFGEVEKWEAFIKEALT